MTPIPLISKNLGQEEGHRHVLAFKRLQLLGGGKYRVSP